MHEKFCGILERMTDSTSFKLERELGQGSLNPEVQ